MSTVPTGPPRRSPFRRLRFPAAVIALVALAYTALFVMQRFEIGLEYLFDTMMGAQFLTFVAILALAAWFLFFSGLGRRVRLGGVLVVLLALGAAFATIRTIEFDGDFGMTARWRWEPTGDELLARHLAAATPAAGGVDLTVGPTDSPWFRGPASDGVAPGVTLADDWTAAPPKVAWKHPVGTGHAGIAVAGNSAVTIEQRDGNEVIVCYDRDTGSARWSLAYPARFDQSEPMGGDGPRTTPAIAHGMVYTLGATGELVCVDGSTGTKRWQVNILADNGAKNLEWGLSGSPVIWKDLVIVNPGIDPANTVRQAVAAYDRHSGKKAWASGSSQAGYASPQVVTLDGYEQVLVFDAAGLGGYEPATGEELWRHPWKTVMDMNSAQPIVTGRDRVFLSSEKSEGGATIEVKRTDGKWQTREVWRTRGLNARFCSPLFYKGHIFVLTDGRLTCVNADDGKRMWIEGNYGNGQLVRAGDLIVITSERGKVFLVAADTAEWRELDSVPVFTARTWNIPALAGNRLYLRNHSEIACLELPTPAK